MIDCSHVQVTDLVPKIDFDNLISLTSTFIPGRENDAGPVHHAGSADISLNFYLRERVKAIS